MTAARQAQSPISQPISGVLRWGIAAAFAALFHFAAVWIILHPARTEPLANATAEAALIELEPMTVAPRAPAQEKPAGPQAADEQPRSEVSQDANEVAPPEPVAPPTETQKDDAGTEFAKVESSTRVSAEPAITEATPAAESASVRPSAAESAEEVPALPMEEMAEAVLPRPSAGPPEPPSAPPPEPQSALPEASPAPIQPSTATTAPRAPSNVREEPKTAPSPHLQRPKSAKSEDGLQPRRPSAPPASQARLADVSAGPVANPSQTLATSLASWRGELMAHLNRFKRFPSEAAKGGTAVVAFGVDRAGVIVSVKLIASAGDPALDEAAIGLFRRASPVPPPPPSEGKVINLSVPIRFDR